MRCAMPEILGKKIGMTQMFTEEGERLPVTIIQAGPCWVTAVRETERDGYRAVQLAFGEVKESRLTGGRRGHLKRAGAPALRELAEFRLPADDERELKIGEQVTVEGFEHGQIVKVAGRSKGKGFQGTIRRHNFSRGPVSHGSHNVRAPGSVGASADALPSDEGPAAAGSDGQPPGDPARPAGGRGATPSATCWCCAGRFQAPRASIVEVRSE